MIQLKDISRIYQMGDERVYALKKASLHIRKGEFVSITAVRQRKIYDDEYYRLSGLRR